jgi:uncharacterized protein YceK
MRQVISSILICLTTSGCLSLLQSINPAEEHLVGAEAMTSEVPVNGTTWDLSNVPPDQRKTYVGLLLDQSEKKCHAFLGGLSATARGGDAVFDVLTTIFSALGTAFTPLATVHSLTAAASISSGTKTAIDSDIFAKQTATLIIQAIDNTYYVEYKNYTTILAPKSNTDITLSIEYAVIKGFHKDCTLDSALGSLISSQTKASNPQTNGSSGAPQSK